MSDDRKVKGPQDASQIDLYDDYEVRHWAETLGVSEDELRQVVQRVGSPSKAVRQQLQE